MVLFLILHCQKKKNNYHLNRFLDGEVNLSICQLLKSNLDAKL